MDIQPDKKLMGSRGPWWIEGVYMEPGVNFFPKIHIKYGIHVKPTSTRGAVEILSNLMQVKTSTAE